MKKGLIAAALASSMLSGCFVFIPGSVVGAVSDAVTGDKGEHCVPRGTPVGERVNFGFGRIGVVDFVSETPSSRCRDPMMPMRAAVSFPPGLVSTLKPLEPIKLPVDDDSLPLFGSLSEPTGVVCNYGNGKAERTLTMAAGQKCPPFIAK